MKTMDNYLKQINNELFKLDTRIKRILYVGIPLIIILPYLFTQYSILDFTQSGQIGDTIGGITAPIIGLISAFIIYFSFVAQIKANQIQITAIQDTREQYKKQEQQNINENRLRLLENQYNAINDIWLDLIKGLENRSNHIPYHDHLFIHLMLSDGRVSILNNFFFKINVFMEDLKQNELIQEELKKKKILSQFAVLICMSCDDFFDRVTKYLNPENDENIFKTDYTLGILSTIKEISKHLKEEEYYYRDQDRIIRIIKNSIIVD